MSDLINDKGPLPSDISSTTRVEAIPDSGDEQKDLGTQDKSFANMMQNKEQQTAQMTPKVETVSPFDLAGLGAKPIASPNMDTLMSQANSVQGTLGGVQDQLSTPNLKLKSSQKYLVKNKLTDVNNHLSAANAKLGLPPLEKNESSAAANSSSGPIAQYLGYVTDGMNQLEAAKRQLGNISTSGKNLAPADFMLLQLKFNKAQQELDFTSALLGKCVEGVKTIMGVQI
jgi:hypothetical protein